MPPDFGGAHIPAVRRGRGSLWVPIAQVHRCGRSGEPAGLGADLRAAAELVRKGNRVCHVRVAVTQGEVLVAEGRAVYNIHRRTSE